MKISEALKELEDFSERFEILQRYVEELEYNCTSLQNDYSNKCTEMEELNSRNCETCIYCKDVYSYTYPLCIYNENEPFQIHNKKVLKCSMYK